MRTGLLIDLPKGTRKQHQEAIPRSGGVAILIGWAVACLLWLPDDGNLGPLGVSLLLITLVGLVDDICELGPKAKLLGQVAAATCFLYGYGGVPDLPFFPLGETPAVLGYVVSFGFLLAVTNAVNLSDGLDGLAAGNGLLSLGFLGLLAAQADQIGLMVVALATAGGLVGFLRFNTHPASIFMGDTGSQFVGFTGGAIALLLLNSKSFPMSPLLPVLIFGLPLLDTAMVIGLRKYRGRPVFRADRSHIHHQLLRLGFYHYETVAILYFLQASVLLMAFALRYSSDLIIALAYSIYAALIVGSVGIARANGWSVSRSSIAGPYKDKADRRNHILRKLSWYHFHAAKVVGVLLLGVFLVGFYGHVPRGSLPIWANGVLLLVMVTWLALVRTNSDAIVRLVCYSASAVAMVTIVTSPIVEPHIRFIDAYMCLVAVALALAIRLTRRSVFHLDTQDYLVVLIVVFTPMILPDSFADEVIVRAALYLGLVFYACEYVVSKGHKTKSVVSGAGLAAILGLGLSTLVHAGLE